MLLVGPVQEDLSVSERIVPACPAQDGAVVAEPPLREVGARADANRQRLQRLRRRPFLLGRSWSEFAATPAQALSRRR